MAGQPRRERLFETLSDNLRGLIREGVFAPGQRLPSVRQLAHERDVSVATVLKAYRDLEDEGYLRARPQAGFYVRSAIRHDDAAMASTDPPARSVEVTTGPLVYEMLRALADPALVPLGGAIPAPELLPVDALRRLLRRRLRGSDARAEVEAIPAGFGELRRAIARCMLHAGCAEKPDGIVVTNGCLEALNIALRAVAAPGDTIAVESPTYFGVLQALDDLGLKALELPTDPRTGVDGERLLEAARQGRIRAAVLSPTVQNPLGAIMPPAAKRALCEGMASLGVPIIEDDIYGEMGFADSERPPALKAFDDSGNVLYCSSFSKTLAPGYRVGWIAPGRFLERAQVLKTSSSFATSGPAQLAIADYLGMPGYQSHIRRQKKVFESSLARAMAVIDARFPAATCMTHPQGGYLLWVQVPGVDSYALYRRVLERGVTIAPGRLFSAHDAYGDCFRLNCGHPWSARIEGAIGTIADCARTLAGASSESAPAVAPVR